MFSRRLLPTAVVGVVFPLFLSGCDSPSQVDPRTEAPRVRVATVKTAEALSRTFTGVVAARVQSDLGFRVAGKIAERLVDTGQTVKRGQPLLRLDPIDLQLALQAQREAVAAAHAKARQAAEDEARYRDLRGTGAISVSGYDQVKATADSARAQLKAAEAQADVALNASRYAVLVADADSTVVDTLAEPGQVVSAGQVVVRLARAGAREAIVQLPETLRPALGSWAQAALIGTNDQSVPARLRQLSDSTDRETRTFEARYVLEGALATAPLGTTVTVSVPESAEVRANALAIPIGALHDEGKGAGVWRIQGSPQQVVWVPVQIRRLSDDSALVEGALQAGDRVVALGVHLLHEGQAIRIAGGPDSAVQEGQQP
ncbi:efflux RND transporter periplasmic adaptor subunit [Pseudomonas sp. CBMAI 2609]|uniref:Efflux RND transporter periplasmic adaptor subunit n=1 Tax=Pseudomonas flavocrustae TaxID=2991719 RepID=A0ABT6II86_9PSED|nr:efflux RND transporter periplasmic adaptor subunit [Pseudomonas sp. CBMAI 2609]MDH4764168.1 efflux RND transporter periplasmic adaptor subunit [Pseudomonas sp. CBMAI 2609]